MGKNTSFYRLRILFPVIVCSQILFVGLLTRNIISLRVIPPREQDSEIKDRTLSSYQHALKQDYALLLKREREEKVRRYTEETNFEVENEESSKSSLSSTKILNNIDDRGLELEEGLLPSQDEVDKERKLHDEEFTDRLINLRDELLSAVPTLSEAGIETVPHNNDKAKATAANDIRHTLAKPPPNQPIDFLIPILSPPKINATDTSTIVLVPSHQGSFVKRQAIRETWMTGAKHSSTVTVLFVIAQSDCKEFESDMHVSTTPSNNSNSASPTCDEIDHNFLKLEQKRNQDLLEIPMKEKYSRLPEKMMQAYNWAVKNIPNLKWIAKADDDMFVDVRNLEIYVRKYNSEIPMVIGDIIYHSLVAKWGKWADYDYPKKYYPYWPKGSAGHVLSRSTLEYFIENSESLHRYQGEDVSIGIWLDEARKSGRLNDVTYIHAPQIFIADGISVCKMEHNVIMVGHDLTAGDQMYCHKKSGSNGSFGSAWEDKPGDLKNN